MMVWKIIRGKKESCAPSSSSVRTTLVWRTPFQTLALKMEEANLQIKLGVDLKP